jgi:hypothetical protein
MALTNATIASPVADSLGDVEAFKTYLTDNRPDKAALLLKTDDELSAYLRQASAIFNTLEWKGYTAQHSILFKAETITITNNVITFDNIPLFSTLGIYPNEITGDSYYTYRTGDGGTTFLPDSLPYWIKLIGCANSENDGFLYPYSVNDNSITVDFRFKRMTNEAATTDVDVWLEAYAEGAYQGFYQSQSWPRLDVNYNNTLSHEIPAPILTALFEMTVFQSTSNLVANNSGISTKDISSLDLGGELVVEFDRAEPSKVQSIAALSTPVPDHILTMIKPYLARLPGIESNSGVCSAMRF